MGPLGLATCTQCDGGGVYTKPHPCGWHRVPVPLLTHAVGVLPAGTVLSSAR